MTYTLANHKHTYTKENPDLCYFCGLLKTTIEAKESMKTEKEEQQRVKEIETRIKKLVKEIEVLNWKAKHIYRIGIKPYEDFLRSL